MNYNALALMGQEITDEDYAETFNIPAEFIGTPKINEFMLDRQINKEIELYQRKGMSQKEAAFKANSNAAATRKEINQLMKQRD